MLIYVIIKNRWENLVKEGKTVLCTQLNDIDVIYIGESFVKSIEYIEEEDVYDDRTTYHVMTINLSRCQYMSFKYGLSNHTHLEKIIYYKNYPMKRSKDNIDADEHILNFDLDLNQINTGSKEEQRFEIINLYDK